MNEKEVFSQQKFGISQIISAMHIIDILLISRCLILLINSIYEQQRSLHLSLSFFSLGNKMKKCVIFTHKIVDKLRILVHPRYSLTIYVAKIDIVNISINSLKSKIMYSIVFIFISYVNDHVLLKYI